jgi:hypothetical protein
MEVDFHTTFKKNLLIFYCAGFANPPENVTCFAQDRSSNLNFLPKAILEWDLPSLTTNYLEYYAVNYGQEEYLTMNTSLEINLPYDQLDVEFQVYVKAIDRILRDGSIASCAIKNTLERRTCKLQFY